MTKPSAPRRMRRSISTAPIADDWMPVSEAILLKLADLLPPSDEISTAALSVARDEWIEGIAEEILTETRPEDRDNRWFDSVRTLLHEVRTGGSPSGDWLRARLYDVIRHSEWPYGTTITELVCERIAESAGQDTAVPVPSIAGQLAGALGLTDDEVRVLVVLYVLSELDDAVRAVKEQSERCAARTVADLCGLSVGEFARLSGAAGRLTRLGLLDTLRTARDGVFDMRLTPPLLFSFRSGTLDDLSAGVFTQSRLPRYRTDDFSLPSHEAHTLGRLLNVGKSVLITGEPGVGKTEFAFALAASLGKSLRPLAVDVMSESRMARRDSRGRMITARMAAALMDSQREILLIDEADAMLQSATGAFGFFGWGMGSYDKAELNELLDDLSVPVLWITNEIRGVPPSALRRFAHVCEFPHPSGPVRRRMIQDRLAESGMELPTSLIESVAGRYDLTPGAIDRMVTVLEAEQSPTAPEGGTPASPEDVPSAVSTLEGRAVEYLSSASRGPLSADFRLLPCAPTRFDPRFCVTSVPLADLARHTNASVRAARPVKLLFEGPPGGGKTHYALHLSQELGREAKVVGPSDLVSPYVGETEQNIAREFRQAEVSGVVLILDEADALLGDRSAVNRSYELRWASEFLQRLQEFAGTLIACTNRVEAIDQAIRRRFHRHVYFGALSADLVEPALAHMFPDVTFSGRDCRELRAAPNLMMSDFATAVELFEVAQQLEEDLATPRERVSRRIVEDILDGARSREMSREIGF